VLSLLLAIVLAGTALYMPQASPAPLVVAAAASRGAAAQQTVSSSPPAGARGDGIAPTPEQLRQVAQTHGDAVTLMGEHFGVATGPDPAWFIADTLQPRVMSEDLRRRRVERLHAFRATIGQAGTTGLVDFLVATVPDPIDSNLRWQFDPTYDALQRAIAASGYALERFYIPDWDLSRNPDTDARALNRLHERLPGVVLFRKGTDLLVLFLVFETATGGVHQEAFRQAAWTIAHWRDSYDPPPEVRVLGPMFSGSIVSLGRAMESVRAEVPNGRVRYRIITGAATNAGNAEVLTSIVKRDLTYRTTVLNDEELLSSLGAFFDGRVERNRMAVLVESNTAYGSALRAVLEGRRLCTEGCAVIPFPLHISRLRGAAAGAPLAQPGDVTRNVPLLLEEPVQPRDQVPPMAPRLTSSSTDVALDGILSTINREHLSVVGLFATDARDKLFLAQQIAMRSPDTLIFTIEGDVLLAHSDFRRYTHGMIVAASYPLFTGTQLWSPTATGSEARHQFASTSAQGVYNAAVAMLNYDDSGAPLSPAAPRLVDYRHAGADVRHGPFAWISVVGRDGIWPLHRDPVCFAETVASCANAAQYTQRTSLPGPDASSPDRPIHPSPWLLALFIAQQVFVLAHVVWWRARGRSTPTASWWASPDRERRRRGFTLAIVCLGVLALMQFGTLVVIDGHNRVIAGYGPSTLQALGDLASWQPSENGSAVLIGLVAECVGALLLGVLLVIVATTAAVGMHAAVRLSSDRMMLAIGVGAGLALAFLVPAATEGVLGDQPLTLLNRGLQPFSGVSPFAPMVILLVAAYAWPAAQLSRVATSSLTDLPDDQESRLADLAIGNLVRLVRNTREAIVHPVLQSWNWVGVAAAVVAGALFTYVQGVQTTERALFDFFYMGAWILLQAFVCVAFAQHYRLWRATKALLKGLALHPMADAYREVPRELFANRLPPRGPRLIHLQHAATAQAMFTARPAPAGLGIAPLPAPSLQATLNADLAIHGCRIADSATWKELLSDMRVLVPWVPLFRARAGGDTPAAVAGAETAWNAAAERYLAIPIALVLREVIARMVRGVYAIFVALMLLVAYQVSFPAYPRRAMMAVTWVYVLVGVATAVATVVSIERDGVMSRLSGTSAGKIQWDAAFLQRTVLPLLFALLTLFAVQFPNAGNTLLQWLRPVQTALP
jgi:hypothetical protein